MIMQAIYHNWQTGIVILLCMVLVLLPAPATATYQERGATLDLAASALPLTLDPVLATDPESLTAVENLFLALTDIDPFSGQIRPELATQWQVSEDGLQWTFTLRGDVNWVRYDPQTGTATALRNVVAEDVVYAIKRACDPRLTLSANISFINLIAGCNLLSQTLEIEVTDLLVYGNTVQVSAPDDTTLVIGLQKPARYFLAVTPLLRPVPREAIEEFGIRWTEPGKIMTNGPYLVLGSAPGVGRMFGHNYDLPLSLQHGGNIDRVVYHIIEDSGTRLALYNDHTLDMVAVTPLQIQEVLSSPAYAGQIVRVFDLNVYFFGFSHRKTPFNDVHVRRAFSAIIDRQAFIEQNRLGRGLPMLHLTPPGVPFGPDITGIGSGFDLAYAREQLALAGYPNCAGFPSVRIMAYPGTEEWGEFLVAAAEHYLGCNPALFIIETMAGPLIVPELWQAHVWTVWWRPTYPDANAWLGDALGCEVQSPLRRSCSPVDDLIHQAAVEPDDNRRAALYAQIEAAFFDRGGEQPIAPIFVEGGAFFLAKPWLSGPFENDGRYTGRHWDAYRIDIGAKRAASSGAP